MTTPLTELKGIGVTTAEDLQAHDIDSVEAMAQASIAEITKVKGFGGVRALRIKEAAVALLRSRDQTVPVTAAEAEPTGRPPIMEEVAAPAEVANDLADTTEVKKETKGEKKKKKAKKDKKDKKDKKGKKNKKNKK